MLVFLQFNWTFTYFSLWAHVLLTEERRDMFRRTEPCRPSLLWPGRLRTNTHTLGWFWCRQTNRPELREVETRHAGFLQQKILIKNFLTRFYSNTSSWHVCWGSRIFSEVRPGDGNSGLLLWRQKAMCEPRGGALALYPPATWCGATLSFLKILFFSLQRCQIFQQTSCSSCQKRVKRANQCFDLTAHRWANMSKEGSKWIHKWSMNEVQTISRVCTNTSIHDRMDRCSTAAHPQTVESF